MNMISNIQASVITDTPLDFSERIWIEPTNTYNVVKLPTLRKLK